MMKLSKKVLAAFSVAAMLAVGLSFTACGEDDDENGLIEKQDSKNYSINVEKSEVTTDEAAAANRGYDTTTFKHRGELVRFTLNNPKEDGGVLGFIWDLTSTDSKRNFFVLGLAVNTTSHENKVSYYVSKYYNVIDINARNFGAYDNGTVTYDKDDTTGKAMEYDVTNATKSSTFVDLETITDNTDKIVIWADIYPSVDYSSETNKSHTAGKTDDTKYYTGGWTIDFYKGTADSETLGDKIENASIDISKDVTGYCSYTDRNTEGAKQVPQNYLAVYANVYKNKGLHGAWYLHHDYYADEVVEE